jgi:hypothetical protein
MLIIVSSCVYSSRIHASSPLSCLGPTQPDRPNGVTSWHGPCNGDRAMPRPGTGPVCRHGTTRSNNRVGQGRGWECILVSDLYAIPAAQASEMSLDLWCVTGDIVSLYIVSHEIYDKLEKREENRVGNLQPAVMTRAPIKLVREWERRNKLCINIITHIYITNYYMSWLLDWLNVTW